MTTRGIRNNNPLNVERSPDNNWQGKFHTRQEAEAAGFKWDDRFEVMRTPIDGLRMAARLIINHYDKKRADTVRKLVTTWAPKSENDTDAYVKYVARQTGFAPDERLDFHAFKHLKPVLVAMLKFECGGNPYTDAQIDAALVRAGVSPEKPLTASRTIKGAQVASMGIVSTGAIDGLQQNLGNAQSALTALIPYLDAAKWALLGVTLLGVALIVWARVDDWRRGIR